MSRNPGARSVVLGVLAVTILVASGVTPGEAHDGSYGHIWRRHYRPLARETFFTRTQATNRFVDVGEQASDADLLDGQDSSAFAGTVHEHDGADITSGTVAEARIAATIARVADVFTTVLAADGSGSGLNADLLDGQDSAAFAAAAHGHGGAAHEHDGADITSGTIPDARIAVTIARVADVLTAVLAADGSGSGLDADLLDGQDATAFAGSAHGHSGADITSGTVAEARIAAAIARVADVFTTVLAADGSGSGLDADLLDGQDATAFAGAGHGHTLGTDDRRRAAPWFKEAADSVASATTSERVVFVAPDAITITDVIVLPAAALTASDINYATVTIARRDAGGGGRVTVASETTQTSGSGGSGDWTAFAAVSLGSLSNVALGDGQSITIEIAKSGLGVALPVLVVQVEYTVD